MVKKSIHLKILVIKIFLLFICDFFLNITITIHDNIGKCYDNKGNVSEVCLMCGEGELKIYIFMCAGRTCRSLMGSFRSKGWVHEGGSMFLLILLLLNKQLDCNVLKGDSEHSDCSCLYYVIFCVLFTKVHI